MDTVPPELLSDDGREARAAELQHRIAREWVRYAVIDGLVLGVPFLVLALVYIGTDAVSVRTLAILAGVVFAVSVTLTLFWVYRRIRPLERELESLERATAR